MTTAQIFNHPKFGDLRSTDNDGNPLFNGNDVGKSLGYKNVSDALSKHCKGVVKRDTPTSGGIQTVSFIPESDLYRLAMRSKLPNAEEFQDWVVEDVLPTIRKTGTYSHHKAPTHLETAKMLVSALEEKEALELQNARLLPDAQFGRELKDSENLLTITQVAKPLGIKSGQALNKFLHEHEVIFKQSGDWMPYSKYQDSGYFEIVAIIKEVKGEQRTYHQLKVTAEGRKFIHALWREQQEAA